MREKRDFEQRRLESTTTDFRVDSFEYRLLNELEYRKTVTDSTTVSTSPPKLTQKPRNTKLIEGATAIFTVKHEGNPTVTWFKDGVRIVESNRITITNEEKVTKLEIKYVLQPDSGHYTVLLQNELGSVVASSLLAVEKLDEENTLKLAPKFLKIPPNQTLQSGKCARIETRCVGRPIPDITWYINGREVADSGVNKIIINEQGMHCLLITSVGKEHGGVLTCIGRNCVGEDRFEIELNLEQEETLIAPKFVERFNALEVEVGSEICLNVRAVGVPPPQITWQKVSSVNSNKPNKYVNIISIFTDIYALLFRTEQLCAPINVYQFRTTMAQVVWKLQTLPRKTVVGTQQWLSILRVRRQLELEFMS